MKDELAKAFEAGRTDAVMAKAEQAESIEDLVAIAREVFDAALLGSGVAGGLAYDAALVAALEDAP